ncbi:hypothetical protein STANM309S_01263 [Streptomyces tanashiensis]
MSGRRSDQLVAGLVHGGGDGLAVGTNAALRGITEFTDVSVFAQNLTTALGLGLAIDYALFVVRRYREELAAGADTYTAVRTTLRTAGRTVLFSALTVAVSLAAMLVFPQYFLRSFAYAGIAVVLLAATAALTLLPAALVLLGDRVNASTCGGSSGAAGRPRKDTSGAGWGRAAALVMRRAPVFAIVTTAGLVLLGLPFLGVKFGTADDRQLPVTASSRVVQDQLRDGFPGNPGGGITVLAEGAATPAQYADFRERIAALDGVGRAEGPVTAGGGSAYFTVVPEGETVGAGAQRVVGELRAAEAPFATSVTGPAAVLVDSKDAIADRLPWAAGIIVLVTLLLASCSPAASSSRSRPSSSTRSASRRCSAPSSGSSRRGTSPDSSASPPPATSRPPCPSSCSAWLSDSPWTTGCSCSPASRRSTTPPATTSTPSASDCAAPAV